MPNDLEKVTSQLTLALIAHLDQLDPLAKNKLARSSFFRRKAVHAPLANNFKTAISHATFKQQKSEKKLSSLAGKLYDYRQTLISKNSVRYLSSLNEFLMKKLGLMLEEPLTQDALINSLKMNKELLVNLEKFIDQNPPKRSSSFLVVTQEKTDSPPRNGKQIRTDYYHRIGVGVDTDQSKTTQPSKKNIKT